MHNGLLSLEMKRSVEILEDVQEVTSTSFT